MSEPGVDGITSGWPVSIPFPVEGSTPVILHGKFPISEASWDQIMAVLVAMKPMLIRRSDEAGDVERERDALRAKVDAVRRLHEPDPENSMLCSCELPRPCPTTLALEGEA